MPGLLYFTAVLDAIIVGSRVYLTKNGRGCFTIMDMREQEIQQEKASKYDKMEAQLKLMSETISKKEQIKSNILRLQCVTWTGFDRYAP